MEAQLPVGRVVRPVGVVEAVELGVHRQRPDLEQLAHALPTGVVGILGRNGMGKTTLVRSIVGFTPPRREQVFFKDHDITGWPSNRSVSLGLGLVPQGRRVFPSLTVLENLLVAAREQPSGQALGWRAGGPPPRRVAVVQGGTRAHPAGRR